MKIELFNDNFQNFKRYGIPKAQLVIADIPYNLGKLQQHLPFTVLKLI